MLSPCPRRFRLQSSGSSTHTIGTGDDFTLAGLFEPTSLRKPPGNFLNSCLCPCTRARVSTFSRRAGVASTIGVNFSSMYSLAAPSFGNSTSIGLGSVSIVLPKKLPNTPEVHATCADFWQQITCTFGSSRASSGLFSHSRYGVTPKTYLPGRAASILDK